MKAAFSDMRENELNLLLLRALAIAHTALLVGHTFRFFVQVCPACDERCRCRDAVSVSVLHSCRSTQAATLF